MGVVDAKTIDEINIYEASRKAMLEAINGLSVKPEYATFYGKFKSYNSW